MLSLSEPTKLRILGRLVNIAIILPLGLYSFLVFNTLDGWLIRGALILIGLVSVYYIDRVVRQKKSNEVEIENLPNLALL